MTYDEKLKMIRLQNVAIIATKFTACSDPFIQYGTEEAMFEKPVFHRCGKCDSCYLEHALMEAYRDK